MRRPRWIAALVLALAVAAGFAWLGQWQLSFAIHTDEDLTETSEVVRPIEEITEAGTSVNDGAAGMVVSTAGSFVPGDFVVVEQRVHDGREGVWVTGNLATDNGHLAVAIGWAATSQDALHAVGALESELASAQGQLVLEGRYMPADATVEPRSDEDPARIASMAPAQLVNLWQPFDGFAYAGFLVMHPEEGPLGPAGLEAIGLETIDSVPPLPVEKINWLNLFYAVEWVVFGGFAIFFWYRLARDAWEREHELKLLVDAQAEAAAEAAAVTARV